MDKITFDVSGNPTLTTAAHLPGTNINFPSSDPVYDGTNYLYFTTVGAASTPGAICRYDLTSGLVTNLFNFVTNAVASTNFGKQPYCTPVLFNNTLFFTTYSGGTQGKGILGMFALSNNVATKLADLEGTTGQALGASPQYVGGTIYTNPVTGVVSIYLPINKGGPHNFGTILQINFPIATSLSLTVNGDVLSWTGGYPPYSAPGADRPFTKDDARKLLAQLNVDGAYQNHYSPVAGQLKIFFQGGSLVIERDTGKAVLEVMKKRPLINTFDRLHYNPGRWWTWFADGFSVALLAMAITGIFMIQGHHGITRRGGILVAIGVVIPTVFVLLYL